MAFVIALVALTAGYALGIGVTFHNEVVPMAIWPWGCIGAAFLLFVCCAILAAEVDSRS